MEVAEEPSSSRRSPACRGGAQPYRVRWGYGLGRVWPWAEGGGERRVIGERKEEIGERDAGWSSGVDGGDAAAHQLRQDRHGRGGGPRGGRGKWTGAKTRVSGETGNSRPTKGGETEAQTVRRLRRGRGRAGGSWRTAATSDSSGSAVRQWLRGGDSGQRRELRGAEDVGSATPVSSCAGEAAMMRARKGRIGSNGARARDATQRGETAWRSAARCAIGSGGGSSGGADEAAAAAATLNDTVARCRLVGCAISTKSRRRDGGTYESGVGCANRDASDVLRAGRQGPRPKSNVFHGRPSIFSGSMDGS
ncbi:hypothetical protein Scep_027791 [Stephania cephalantha]|uniref:Uncharacterized protein n=1 Tax=Stephania cephalantha TaxID=152367 RepID=A0AAP0HIV2_9MAGN